MQKITYQHAKTTCRRSCETSKTPNCGRRGSALENQEWLFQNVRGAMFELKIWQTDHTVLFARDRQQWDRGEGERANTNRDDAGNRVQSNPQDTEADIAHVNDCDMANNCSLRRTTERRVLETGIEHVEWKARNVASHAPKEDGGGKNTRSEEHQNCQCTTSEFVLWCASSENVLGGTECNCHYTRCGTQSCRQVPFDGQNQVRHVWLVDSTSPTRNCQTTTWVVKNIKTQIFKYIMEIIIDLHIGFPIDNIISQIYTFGICTHIYMYM